MNEIDNISIEMDNKLTHPTKNNMSYEYDWTYGHRNECELCTPTEAS